MEKLKSLKKFKKKTIKKRQQKTETWIVKKTKLGNTGLPPLIHPEVESLNLRQFPNINDFKLTNL